MKAETKTKDKDLKKMLSQRRLSEYFENEAIEYLTTTTTSELKKLKANVAKS